MRQHSWVELTAQELGITLINRGVCGDSTGDMLRRFPQDVLGFNPTHVIIMGGGNDAFDHLPLSTAKANFQAMVDTSRKNRIIPLFGLPIPCTIPEYEAFLADLRKWLECYAREENIPVLDFYSPYHAALKQGRERELLADGVHPDLPGYRLMAKTAVAALRLLLKQPRN
jgi:lysophospholipase L1-like esterase